MSKVAEGRGTLKRFKREYSDLDAVSNISVVASNLFIVPESERTLEEKKLEGMTYEYVLFYREIIVPKQQTPAPAPELELKM